MIVCSQTCFLNILTQLYPKEVLVNAAYYIADLTGPNNTMGYDRNTVGGEIMGVEETQYKYNEEGELVEVGQPVVSIDTLQKYHVMYTRGALNPTSLLTHQPIGSERRPRTPEERFINDLQNTDAALEVYQDIFKQKPRGNGLQILIYSNDQICCQFGWITCEFLSSCFGADVIFIDAKYRTRNIAKQSKVNYVGNKEFAMQTYIPRIRDYELLRSIKDNMTNRGLAECTGNLTNKLVMMTWDQLIHTYELLWPMDPLPRGNYTTEQLKEIILEKILGQRKPSVYDQYENLTYADAFYQMANEYDL